MPERQDLDVLTHRSVIQKVVGPAHQPTAHARQAYRLNDRAKALAIHDPRQRIYELVGNRIWRVRSVGLPPVDGLIQLP
jgi:hypothetical protein